MTPIPISAIASYHAHIYFRDDAERQRAAILRERIAERFVVQLGSWHDRLVGPHGLPMYQIAFAVDVFARFIPWLMLNRLDLTVLVHPNTENPRRDHLTHAFWMGEILPIVHPEQLPVAGDPDHGENVVPNTSPTLPA
jgi:aromatic ring-cleaving dioxygenase